MAHQQAHAASGQAALELDEKAQAGVVRRDDAAQVQEEELAFARLLVDGAHHRLHGGKHQVALQLQHPHPAAFAAQRLALLLRPPPARAHLGVVVLQAKRRQGCVAVVEDVQREVVGEIGAGADAAGAVALPVQRRREDADAQLAGKHRHDAAAHAALGRQPDAVDPFARKVVHAAGGHHGQDVVDAVRGDRLLPGDRVHAVVGQGRAHQGQVAAGDADRALLEVRLQDLGGLFVDDAEVAQHPADGAVAVAGLAFGPVHVHVDIELPAGAGRTGRPGSAGCVSARCAA